MVRTAVRVMVLRELHPSEGLIAAEMGRIVTVVPTPMMALTPRFMEPEMAS